MDIVGSSPGIKQPEREADYSRPSSAEVKNAWSYTSTTPHVFMAWWVIKHRVSFTFALLSLCASRFPMAFMILLLNKSAGNLTFYFSTKLKIPAEAGI
jgi:hypothetical protein